MFTPHKISSENYYGLTVGGGGNGCGEGVNPGGMIAVGCPVSGIFGI